jgi:glycosyltransferase involved in cell wall biosynthesis
MDKSLVSLGIICYNYAHFLGEAIESALNQTYKPIEITVINDGSTDNFLI